MGWSQVFFEQKLNTVCGRLQQAKWADPRRSPAILHVADDLALEPDGVGDGSQQDEQRDPGLDHGYDHECKGV